MSTDNKTNIDPELEAQRALAHVAVHQHTTLPPPMNAGCTIPDTAPVTIGAATMLGPQVQIYCANHHRDARLRSQGLERASPVTIGERVWIGGGAIILPGITIADEAIIGAGSVVTRDVAAGVTVVGNPARVVAASVD